MEYFNSFRKIQMSCKEVLINRTKKKIPLSNIYFPLLVDSMGFHFAVIMWGRPNRTLNGAFRAGIKDSERKRLGKSREKQVQENTGKIRLKGPVSTYVQ